jgi:hypothetical protein
MSDLLKTVAAGALLAIGLASASDVYAEQSRSGEASDSHMATGMRHGGMMGMQGGMMGQMGGTMDGCNSMMQGRSQTPNSQFRRPSQPRARERERVR